MYKAIDEVLRKKLNNQAEARKFYFGATRLLTYFACLPPDNETSTALVDLVEGELLRVVGNEFNPDNMIRTKVIDYLSFGFIVLHQRSGMLGMNEEKKSNCLLWARVLKPTFK